MMQTKPKSKLNKSQLAQLIVLIIGIIMVVSYVVYIVFGNIPDSKNAISAFTYLFVLLFALILFIWCMLCKEENQRQRKLFMLMISLSFFSSVFGAIVAVFDGMANLRTMIVACQIMNNSLLAVFWIVFWHYQKNNYKRYDAEMIVDWVITVYLSIYILFSFLNFFTPVLFVVDSTGSIIYRTDYFTLTYMSLWYIFYVVYVFTRKCDVKTKFTLSSYVIFPLCLNILNFILRDRSEINNLYYALTALCFLIPLYLIYFNLHIENARKLEAQKEELSQTRINLMISQIQPHFIYNSLTAIIDLIDKDKEQAKESIVSFSDYLRVNLDSLKEVKLIPFTKELEHIKTYISFEQMRFENIEIDFDIQTNDFCLPALTVQPIVENAIKHGVSKTGVGGKVIISTREESDAFVILVCDNGVGFDAGDVSGDTHVGLYNVEKRLHDMCDGKIEIDSVKGDGTTVRIIIKKESK